MIGNSRKRELLNAPTNSKKRIRKDRNIANVDVKKKRYKKRRAAMLVSELCTRLGNSDRQLANHLLRELAVEHINTTVGAELDEVVQLLLKAVALSKYDNISSKILRTLLALMRRADVSQWIPFIATFNVEQKNLFERPRLDSIVLSIYISALKLGAMNQNDIPVEALTSADRCLSSISCDGEQNAVRRRVVGVQFHVALALRDESNETRLRQAEKLLCRMINDFDFRVRVAAVQGLTELCATKLVLSKSTYTVVKGIAEDVDSGIRIAALRLLVHFANRNCGGTTSSHKVTLSLSDDAFSTVCNALNDLDVHVRIEGSRLLGEFQNVSDALLYQTLDKKMMRSNKASGSVVKVEKSLFSLSKKDAGGKQKRWKLNSNIHKEAEKMSESAKGGWSRGKELHSKAPTKSLVAEEEESIIPHGACGAFVTALEDEFMSVRKAAVYSLGKLAADRPVFAVSALEYLADMFNDEIAEVRLDAINSLTPLVSHGQLDLEQLSVILKCLDDAMSESRQAMRDLLQKAAFADVRCVELSVKALLSCIQRFPDDKQSTFECLAAIGRNHAVFVQAISRRLLDFHSVFHNKEQSVEDINYVGKLILVLNAASFQPAIVALMPNFVRVHYRYLRRSSPSLVRQINVLENVRANHFDEAESCAKAEEIVLKTYERLCQTANNVSVVDRTVDRTNIIRDAQAISSYNENVSGAAKLISCLSEVALAVDVASETVIYGGELSDALSAVRQHQTEIQQVQHQFSGLRADFVSYLAHCRLYMAILELAVLQQLQAVRAEIVAFMGREMVREARNNLREDSSENFSTFVDTCARRFESVGEESKKLVFGSSLCTLLQDHKPELPILFPPVSSISLKWAQITYPNKDAALENAVRFISGLPHAVRLSADLHNLSAEDFDAVRIKITYPDGRIFYVKPRENDIITRDGKTFLNTKVMVTAATAWTDAAEVGLSIVLFAGSTSSPTPVPLFGSLTSALSSASIRVKIHPLVRQ